ncbi:E3 ubiquitin-protein ligase RNF14-like isoform 2-T2 [Menidia menidia]
MSTNLEEQEDELLALQSIFSSEEFVRDLSKPAGEIRVSAEIPADFIVSLKDGTTPRQYNIAFLPPLFLTFEFPEDYPSTSPPSFNLTCSWLSSTQLASLSAQLVELYQATGGAVVLFSWIQFLKEDVLKLLNIYALLELPSDERSSLQITQCKKPSEAKNDEHTPKPHLCGADQLLPSGEFQQNSSQGASGLDSCEADQHDFTSYVSQISLNSDYPKTLSLETVAAHAPDLKAFQCSEFKVDCQDDPFLAVGKSELIPFLQSDRIREEDVLNEGNLSDSALAPLTSSNQLHPCNQGVASLPLPLSDSSPKKALNLSGLSLTPSQLLLSQILIHDAAQKQKVFDTTVFECGVCLMGWLGSDCVQLYGCGHIFCRACLREFCHVQITEGNVKGVTCPQADCTATPTPSQVKNLVGEKLFSRYDRLLLQSTLDSMSDVTYCPRTSCGSVVIGDQSSRAALCSVCSFAFCVNCKKTYHGTNKCDEEMDLTNEQISQGALQVPLSDEGIKALLDDYNTGSKQRRRLLESRYGRKTLKSSLDSVLSNKWKAINTKACPDCFCPIEKDGGCNHMRCTHCNHSFLWA